MTNFKTEKTIMCEYLINDLEYQIKLGEQRAYLLAEMNDFDNAHFEKNQAIKWREQLSVLQQLLEESEKQKSNRPTKVEVSFFDIFANKRISESLNSEECANPSHYYKNTGIVLKDWEKLEEDKLYAINNLRIKRIGKTLMSKYPQETMWYELHPDYDKEFRLLGNNYVYIVN